MWAEIIRFVSAGAMALVGISTAGVVWDLLVNGERRVREVREEGGGLVQKFTGELSAAHRNSTSTRAHGLHIHVNKAGEVVFREKSAISRDAV